jgi:hypothetical protein
MSSPTSSAGPVGLELSAVRRSITAREPAASGEVLAPPMSVAALDGDLR